MVGAVMTSLDRIEALELQRLRDMCRQTADTIAEIVSAAADGSDTYGDPADSYYWSDYPLEIVDVRGRPFTVVLAINGPHIEITADGWDDARLVGSLGKHTVTLWDDAEHTLTRFLELFITREDLQ